MPDQAAVGGGQQKGDGSGAKDRAFYVILSLVFVITVGSLALALWKSSQRKEYVNAEVQRVATSIPKGDVKPAELQAFEYQKQLFSQEASNQQSIITSLLGVFQAGTGAIVGLLTGRVTAK